MYVCLEPVVYYHVESRKREHGEALRRESTLTPPQACSPADDDDLIMIQIKL